MKEKAREMFMLEKVRYRDILDIEKLSIEKHKVTCVVGESGSGKTTLLRLLNALISCDSGHVRYHGQVIDDIDAVALRREVVMLPQVPVIFPGNIRDNLLVGLQFAEKASASDDRLREVLSFVHLAKALDDEAESLSGGEKQRLALGRIILMDPKVFLLDEPSASLDEETERVVIEQLVAHTKHAKKTLVMVTHSQKIAQKYADTIIRISRGGAVMQKGEQHG